MIMKDINRKITNEKKKKELSDDLLMEQFLVLILEIHHRLVITARSHKQKFIHAHLSSGSCCFLMIRNLINENLCLDLAVNDDNEMKIIL
jgi:hypothetical protein